MQNLSINEADDQRFYYDPLTHERVKVTYRVLLSRPASCCAEVCIEATSHGEAIRLALEADRDGEVEWEYDAYDNETEACVYFEEGNIDKAVFVDRSDDPTSIASLFEDDGFASENKAEANN